MSVQLQNKYNTSSHYKHNFHVFRKGKQLNMQDNFLFFDTETNEKITEFDKSYDNRKQWKVKELTFKMGSCIRWNRDNDFQERFIFYDVSEFWDNVEKAFSSERKQYILFAHNCHFDFKMTDGFNQLFKRGWERVNHYVRNKTYILVFKKGNYILNIWDTTNYIPHELAEIGKVLGYPKLKVDFEKCTKQELEIYCMRDTEILYQFIRQLVSFLVENDLSRLKATASSLSFNIFRHKFYDFDNKKIWIHDFKRAIMLERASYRGGITDVFRLGEHDDLEKMDINSQYSSVMSEIKVPTKLIYYSHESDKKLSNRKDVDENDCYIDLTEQEYQNITDNLMDIYNKFKTDYGIIARCVIWLPKKYAYILNNYGLGKTCFAWGKIEVCLASPELQFVEKYGKILQIKEISVYEVAKLFDEFIDFFYGLKTRYGIEGNKPFREFCKIILNGQYGKWGQKEFITETLDETNNYLIKHQDMILDIVMSKKELIEKSAFVYLGSINSKELYLIDNKLYLAYNTSNNSKESFVAISSFITSAARMQLVRYLLIAGRKNVLYTDTDSLFVNQKGFQNLFAENLISETELGKLKSEGRGKGQFYNPKFYDFEGDRKCKGIRKKGSLLIKETKDMAKYQVELWDKFKSDYKKGNINNQFIRIAEKTMSKKYDKGIIKQNGFIEPYHISQIEKI